MKRVYGFFFFLVLFLEPSYAGRRLQSFQCEETYEHEEDLDDVMPFKEYLQFLVEIEVYSTKDFVKKLKKADFPDGMSEKPLRTYSELRGQWSVLWDRVHELRLSNSEEEQNIPERRKMTSSELRVLVTEVNRAVEEEIKEEEIEILDEASLEEVEEGSPDNRKPAEILDQVNLKKMEDNNFNSQDPANRLTTEREAEQTETAIGVQNRETEIIESTDARREKLLVLMRQGKPGAIFREQRKERILSLIAENLQISTIELASKTGVSTGAINRATRELQEEGYLARAGFGDHFSWKVFKEGNKPSDYDLQKEIREETLTLITENPRITVSELADKIGVSEGIINYTIVKLEKAGYLIQVGSDKDSYWKVLKGKIREKKVLALIEENSYITRSELAAELGVSERTISLTTTKLTVKGRLIRIGPATNGGHWKVLKRGEKLFYIGSPDQREEKALTLIAENSLITISELAAELGVSPATTDIMIARLKEKGRLVRVGGKNGYLKILEKGEDPSDYNIQEEREEKVLALMEEDSQITIAKLAVELDVTKDTINQIIAKLKEENRVERIGPTHGGRWKVLEVLNENPESSENIKSEVLIPGELELTY